MLGFMGECVLSGLGLYFLFFGVWRRERGGVSGRRGGLEWRRRGALLKAEELDGVFRSLLLGLDSGNVGVWANHLLLR